MTDHKKLIEEALAVGTNDVVANPRRYRGMIRELTDALEAATVEPKWEYGVSICGTVTPASEVFARRLVSEKTTSLRLVRRYAPGPWLPVEGERND